MKKHFTTSEAAKLLSVSADTVLKWVRAGKIESYRTPGGHARIPAEVVKKLLPEEKDLTNNTTSLQTKTSFQYCWEYNGNANGISEECQQCVAYKSRASRCYEMIEIPEEFGHLKLHCDIDCQNCEYYKVTYGKIRSALIVSHNSKLIESLKQESTDSDLQLGFAASEYECAVMIDKLKPDYVIVDVSIGEMRSREICNNIANDERIPFTRIILTSRTVRDKDFCDADIFGWITKPFSHRQLNDFVKGILA